MSRQLRIQYPGAIYHLLDRGDHREDIFHDEIDRLDFLKTLAETCHKTGFQVRAWCLMRNHFHLVLQTPNATLVEEMRRLRSACTLRLNHHRKLVGHLFSGRYKALVVGGSANRHRHSRRDCVQVHSVEPGLLASDEPLGRVHVQQCPTARQINLYQRITQVGQIL